MPFLLVLLFVLAGCATPSAVVVAQASPEPVKPAPVAVAKPAAAPVVVAQPAPAPAEVASAPAVADDKDDADDDSSDDSEGDDAAEAESHEVATGDTGGPRYTKDLSDAELEKLWKESPQKLGSMSVGFVDAGRLINGEQIKDGPGWVVISPDKAWGTHETVSYLEDALRHVHAQYPDAPPCRVNQIGAKDGGWLRPHKSHQNGRDVDIGFYYPGGAQIHTRAREKVMDVALNWALLKAIISYGDVQFVLTDRRVQKVLYEYALAHGEDKAWLDTLFHAGPDSLVKHARHHRDHFHVRYYNPRAQELGRRVAPLLAQQPEFNVAMHRVKHGDTLGHIALKYGSTVAMIKKANHMKSVFLRLGQVLQVPLRGACTHCPIPGEVIVPPRDLPPELARALAAKTTAEPKPQLVAEAVAPAQATKMLEVENPVAPKPSVASVVNIAMPIPAPRAQPTNASSGELPAARAP